MIAIAIAGAMAAPLAAQAGEAAIYGKMHVSVDVFDNDTVDTDAVTAGNQGEDSGTGLSSNSSRIGFKGSEDLGGGMSAVWQVENDVDLTGDAGGWAERNSFVGLAGGFGTVLIGNHDTPLKDIRMDFFGDTIGDNRAITELDQKADLRTGNTIAYISPKMGGLEFIGAYVTDTDKGTQDDNDDDAY
ncbi:MAG TPA: porin, partial [Gammaproteobacteria bacterium]|nr:porin [Gammaproteobacteria bacterium]